MDLGVSKMLTTSKPQLQSRLDGQPQERFHPPQYAQLSEHATTLDGILFSFGLEAESQSTVHFNSVIYGFTLMQSLTKS